jgi:hypothetical protein
MNGDIEIVRKIYKNMNIEYTNQSINTALFDIIEKIAKTNIEKNSPNPHVYKTLIQDVFH